MPITSCTRTATTSPQHCQRWVRTQAAQSWIYKAGCVEKGAATACVYVSETERVNGFVNKCTCNRLILV